MWYVLHAGDNEVFTTVSTFKLIKLSSFQNDEVVIHKSGARIIYMQTHIFACEYASTYMKLCRFGAANQACVGV